MKQNSSPDPAADVRKSLRLYLIVGILLFCGTLATVAVATVPWLDFGKHGFDTTDAVVGLAIASFKATLVAAVFMHLTHERRLVYFLFGLAMLHATGLLLGTAWHFSDLPHDRFFYFWRGH